MCVSALLRTFECNPGLHLRLQLHHRLHVEPGPRAWGFGTSSIQQCTHCTDLLPDLLQTLVNIMSCKGWVGRGGPALPESGVEKGVGDMAS